MAALITVLRPLPALSTSETSSIHPRASGGSSGASPDGIGRRDAFACPLSAIAASLVTRLVTPGSTLALTFCRCTCLSDLPSRRTLLTRRHGRPSDRSQGRRLFSSPRNHRSPRPRLRLSSAAASRTSLRIEPSSRPAAVLSTQDHPREDAVSIPATPEPGRREDPEDERPVRRICRGPVAHGYIVPALWPSSPDPYQEGQRVPAGQDRRRGPRPATRRRVPSGRRAARQGAAAATRVRHPLSRDSLA